MLDAQLGRRRREANAVLGDAGERSGVFREDLLDDQRGLVVVVVEDLEVLRRLDDGGLTEPGDLGPRAALNFADKLNLSMRYNFSTTLKNGSRFKVMTEILN